MNKHPRRRALFSPSAFRLAAAGGLLLALAAGPGARNAAAKSQVGMELAKLGVRNYGLGNLTIAADTDSCALRTMENANYIQLLIPEGELDCDASSFEFGIFGGPAGARVVPESVEVETRIDSFGKLERFVARGEVAWSDGSNAEEFELVIMANIVPRPLEYSPARAYMQPGSFRQAAPGEYAFKVVYEADERAGDLRFLLNKEVLITDSGAKQETGYSPFADTFLAGTTKTYPVSKTLRGSSASSKQGVYRSVSIGEDAEGRLFVVEYEVRLAPETVFDQNGGGF